MLYGKLQTWMDFMCDIIKVIYKNNSQKKSTEKTVILTEMTIFSVSLTAGIASNRNASAADLLNLHTDIISIHTTMIITTLRQTDVTVSTLKTAVIVYISFAKDTVCA